MKETKRAERRHEKRRLLKKRLKQERARWVSSNPTEEDRRKHHEWAERNARKRVTTNVGCSCWMCGNPRRHYGSASQTEDVLTFGEINSLVKLKEGLEEVLTD